jgi:hypothetical protein
MGLVEEFPVESKIQIVKGNVGDNAFGAQSMLNQDRISTFYDKEL